MMFGKLQALSSVSCGQPFQRGCGYGGGVWWYFLKPGDPKMPPRPAIFFILGDFVASLTILLSILGGNMQLRPLPMRFSTVPYLLNFFIIALTVLSGIFNSISITFYLYGAFNKGALSQSCFTENRPQMSKPRATVARKNSLAEPWAEPDSEGEPSAAGWPRF